MNLRNICYFDSTAWDWVTADSINVTKFQPDAGEHAFQVPPFFVPLQWMLLDLVRRTEHDVDAAAISLPPRSFAAEALVRIRNPTVVFLLAFVHMSVWGGVACLPKLLYEL